MEKGRGTVVAAGSSDAMFGGGDSADDDEEVRSLYVDIIRLTNRCYLLCFVSVCLQ